VCLHKKFSREKFFYVQINWWKKFENQSTFAKVIIKHQAASFLGHSVVKFHKVLESLSHSNVVWHRHAKHERRLLATDPTNVLSKISHLSILSSNTLTIFVYDNTSREVDVAIADEMNFSSTIAAGRRVDENSLLVWNWVLDWICSLLIWLWIWICCSSYRQQQTRHSPGGHTRLPNVCNRFLLIRDFQPTWSHDVVRQCWLRPSSTYTAWTLPRARRNRLASLMYFSRCTWTRQWNNSGNKGCATR